MTREELVKQKAQEFASSGEFSPTLTECFITGAEWAKEFMIERACEWFRTALNDDKYYSCIGEETLVPYLIDDFRKAMEE